MAIKEKTRFEFNFKPGFKWFIRLIIEQRSCE